MKCQFLAFASLIPFALDENLLLAIFRSLFVRLPPNHRNSFRSWRHD